MTQARVGRGLCALFIVLCASRAAGAHCSLQMLAPQDGKITAGATTITLGEPDDPSLPAAWQGPLRAGACTFDIGIIEQPLALTPEQRMYVTTYSGSVRTVTLFDLNTCSVHWKSAPFAGVVALTEHGLRMGGTTVRLDRRCVPTMGKQRK
jgi:hypothetical protein